MTALLLVATLVMLIAVVLGLWRVIVGPSTLDRMLGFDLVTLTLAGLVLVFSALTGEGAYVELVLVLSGLGFLTTVAYFYYLTHLEPEAGAQRRDKAHSDEQRDDMAHSDAQRRDMAHSDAQRDDMAHSDERSTTGGRP
ncbi:MAG: hypothetical protein KIT72_03525 [Polyangiaceae bacterium]|nr:hypothetical protein [Polyangiaceae bacterium]MCW5789471.1 hypothetical protein [Polyangiaceae bacterium]